MSPWATAEPLAHVPDRWSFAFSPDGRHAARVTNREPALGVEVVDLARGCLSPVLRGEQLALSSASRLVSWDAERVTIVSSLDAGARALRACRQGGAWRVETLMEQPAGGWLRALPHAPSRDWHPLVACGEDGRATLWRIERRGAPAPLAAVPAPTAPGAWLDRGRTLALNLRDPSAAGTSAFAVDLADGSCRRLFSVSPESDDNVVAFDLASRLLIVATTAFGGRRIGVADLGGDGAVRFLPPPPEGEDRVGAVALTDGGGELVLANQEGALSRLWLADPRERRIIRPLELPPGLIAAPVVSTEGPLRFQFSGPALPALCAEYDLRRNRFRLLEEPDLGPLAPADLSEPEIVRFAGPRGPLEALRYPPRDGGALDATVVALHGGPVDQWSAAFHPELQLFSRLGATVIALNYTGSVGYGRAFVAALEGRAGWVDVADVVAVAEAARRREPSRRVVLYGESYGAFLALLVAALRPDLTDGVVALAPFPSLASMRDAGSSGVAWLAQLLAGEDWERTDLARHIGGLRCPLLLVKGTADRTVPREVWVGLRELLRQNGLQEGRRVFSLELQEEGHDVMTRDGRSRLHRAIREFSRCVSESTTHGAGLSAPRLWSAGGGTRPSRGIPGEALHSGRR